MAFLLKKCWMTANSTGLHSISFESLNPKELSRIYTRELDFADRETKEPRFTTVIGLFDDDDLHQIYMMLHKYFDEKA